jgi:hypothetical protein
MSLKVKDPITNGFSQPPCMWKGVFRVAAPGARRKQRNKQPQWKLVVR